jgi:AcrR family transcriptional regulator
MKTRPSRAAPPPIVPPVSAIRLSRRERHRAEIRDRLFRAALRLFAERGYFATTVSDITEAADVGKGTFFNYYPTKEHVLATYGDERVAAVERALDKARSRKSSVVDALKELAIGAAGQATASPDLLRSIFAAHLSSPSIRSDLRLRLLRVRRLMTRIFELGQERGEISRALPATELARLMHTIFFGITIAWSVNPEGSLSKTTLDVWNLIFSTVSTDKSHTDRRFE